MATITQLSQLDLNGTYSYADYMTWRLDETVELIKGKIMAMSPAPNLKHQRISRNILRPIDSYLRNKRCEVFVAPFDVKLYDSKKSKLADQDAYSVVQPDLCVICDPEKLTTQGCSGAPDWIIEVLSPGNSKKEMRLKYDLYQENGVTEYWLVYPYEQAVYQFVLNQDTEKYQLHAMYAGDDIAKPALFPELEIDLADVFAE
ncbi:MAG: Uma2 family endonuclease [Methylobacter sp.]|nr:Uma2 family endonuclease [Methylobacter sp.]MDP2430307.1 Uma2 family endonuclease [Methylobacter sp.]MDP3053476.1 Uma2 family endonuclease [Methylobacter sp.]MDP3362655.1 Uma2 family endonuclease [Methylobacter sp.]MDZ4217677.1 Uma2 family endonuclease [Methylobacter sp.]